MKSKFRSEKFRSLKNKGVDPKTSKEYLGGFDQGGPSSRRKKN